MTQSPSRATLLGCLAFGLFLIAGTRDTLSAPPPEADRKAAPPATAPKPAAAEEFFDLPERREGLRGGVGQIDKPDPKEALPATVQISLSGGSVSRVRTKTVFQMNYRVQGTLPPGRYIWIISPARGIGYKQNLTTLTLRPEGTLEGTALGGSPLKAPYQMYIVVERLVPGGGLREEKVSDVLTVR
jgi:hypothetical protein